MTDRTLLVAVFNEAQRWTLPGDLVAHLQSSAPESITVTQTSSRTELMDRLGDAAFLMGLPLTESQFIEASPKIEFVQLATAWSESLAPIDAAFAAGARVCGTGAIRAESVAEHAVGLMFALLRRMDVAITAQANHRWAAADMAPSVRDLSGSTVGIINLGWAGRALAKRLRLFGCELLATGAGERNADCVDQLLAPTNVDELVSRSNVVILADDELRRTRPMLDRALLAQMSPGTLLINVAGSNAVADGELLRAVRNNNLAGAGLDCFAHRPLPPTSPLWNASNIIITPSVASASPSYWRRAVDVTIENLRRLQSGQDLLDELIGEAEVVES